MVSDSISSSAVSLSDVTLSFSHGAVQVLKHLNLIIARGETAAMTGPSGAGKTSLLAIIAGLLRPTQGYANTLGHEVSALDENALAELRRTKIGIVFQHFHLLETMTALENVVLPLELAGMNSPVERAKESLMMVGLASRLTHFPSQLSGGERQRVAIARAFALHPPLLLADEPTGNLDYDTGQAVLDTLLSLVREYNTTLIFVTHNNEILKRFDTVYTIKNGGLHVG